MKPLAMIHAFCQAWSPRPAEYAGTITPASAPTGSSTNGPAWLASARRRRSPPASASCPRLSNEDGSHQRHRSGTAPPDAESIATASASTAPVSTPSASGPVRASSRDPSARAAPTAHASASASAVPWSRGPRGRVRRMLARPTSYALLVCLALAPGCGPKEAITPVSEGKVLTAAEIEKDPLALLPGGMVAFGRADAKAFFASPSAPQSTQAALALVPLTPEMGFVPSRDLSLLHFGAYAFGGSDLCAVVEGSFDKGAIAKAAEKGALSAAGKPLVKSSYAERDVFVSGDVAVTILTAKIALAGSQTGVRRALDRVRDRRVKREVPGEWLEFVQKPGTHFGLIADTSKESLSDATLKEAPYLRGARTAKALGTFEGPGANAGGVVTYDTAENAQRGEAQAKEWQQMAGLMNFFAIFGAKSPIKHMETRISDRDLQIAAVLDGPATVAVVGWLAQRLSTPGGAR